MSNNFTESTDVNIDGLTPYQRGQRDGLLSFAAMLRQKAVKLRQNAARWTEKAENSGRQSTIDAANRLASGADAYAVAWEDAARDAEFAAVNTVSDCDAIRAATQQQVVLNGLLVELQRVQTYDPPGFLRSAAVEALLDQINRIVRGNRD